MLGVGISGSTLDNLTTYDEEYMAMVKKHFNAVRDIFKMLYQD